jgi:hypothetical protein
MFFSPTKSLATFQSTMNDIFADLIVEGWVIIYLDDILIYSEHLEEHCTTVKEVLRILQEHKLFLKPEKCEFKQQEVEYLGVIVGNGKIRMDPIKVEGVCQWATLKNRMYRVSSGTSISTNSSSRGSRIMPNFSCLTRKDYKWQWGDFERKAFNQLILAVTLEPVLHFATDNG